MKTSFIRYEKVYRSFQRFFDDDNLMIQFERKANLNMVKKLDEEKADRTELNVTKVMIENVNDRLKHVSIIQNELSTILKPL